MRNSPTVSQLFVAPLRNKPLKRRRFRHEKKASGIIRKPYWRRIRDSLTTILKPSNSNNSKGYGVRYTCFVQVFDAGFNQNQIQADMCRGPFPGNPKADRSETEGFWDGSLPLILLFHESVFYLRQWTDTMTSSHRNPYFSRKVYLRRCRCVIRKTTSLVHKPIMGHAPAPYFRTSTMDSARTHLAVPIISAKVLFKPVASSTE